MHSKIFFHVGIDDAFITFRYADNLAHGRGFVFNEGEHVEGTSTFLETILLAGFRLFGADMLVASRIVGLASYAALLVAAFLIVLEASVPFGFALGVGAVGVLAASSSLAWYAVTGLETLLFAALLLTGVLLHLRAVRTGNDRPWSLVLGAVAITRPEGAGYFLILSGWLLLALAVGGGRPREAMRRLLKQALWFLSIFAPVCLFRLLYFHAFVPNTLIAKANLLHRLSGMNLGSIVRELAGSPAIDQAKALFLQLGVGTPFVVLGWLNRRTRYASTVLLSVAFAAFAIDVLDEGDWMPFSRLLTPALGPLVVAMALGIAVVLFRPGQRLFGTHILSLGVATWVFCAAASGVYPGSWPFEPAEPYRIHMGQTLAHVRRNDDLLATDMAGVIPFYSGMRTLDMNGLCDRYIATHGEPIGTMGKVDREYVLSKRPTFIQTNFTDEMRELFDNSAFEPMRHAYYAVETPFFRDASDRDKKILVVRKDRPDVAEVAKELGGNLVDLEEELKRIAKQ